MNCSQFIDPVSCSHCGRILICDTEVAVSNPFAVMTDIFVIEFTEFSENI